MVFSVRFTVTNAHVLCRVFVNTQHGAPGPAMCGELLVKRGEEFKDLMHAFSGAQFISNDVDVGIEEASLSV